MQASAAADRPTDTRASFIITNMQARPWFRSPTIQPTAPSFSPKASAVLTVPRLPIL